MRVAIMQPYFLPYIGYWQLMGLSDVFVVYDDIQYTKKGWINRNYMLLNGEKHVFSIPIKKDSDFLDIKDRHVAKGVDKISRKMLAQIRNSYHEAPYFHDSYPVIEDLMLFKDLNLFNYIKNSIEKIASFIGLESKLVVSSELGDTKKLKSQDRVLEICKRLNASEYINPEGGVGLYDGRKFAENGVDLSFLVSRVPVYRQFKIEFVSHLSILDIMMFNSIQQIKSMLSEYDLKGGGK